jgi:hypothetical protein
MSSFAMAQTANEHNHPQAGTGLHLDYVAANWARLQAVRQRLWVFEKAAFDE